jgi:hypothetical protein
MIIPLYDEHFKVDDKGLAHSYPNFPPNYSEPQITYSFTYDGFMNNVSVPLLFNWSVQPPFYILSGQNTKTITLELKPSLTKDREGFISGSNVTYKKLKYSDLNLEIIYEPPTTKPRILKDSINIYYRQGPLWKIQGNKFPKIKLNTSGKPETIETYELIPQYDQTGFPPKNITEHNSYTFVIKGGTVKKFYGGIPPTGTPLVDILWHTPGSGYLAFYSTWTSESVKFPNVLDIFIS